MDEETNQIHDENETKKASKPAGSNCVQTNARFENLTSQNEFEFWKKLICVINFLLETKKNEEIKMYLR